MDSRPIGVFDSGLGGISVLNHLVQLLPNEHFIYIADSKWCPYGSKPAGSIISRSKQIVDYFHSRNVKLVVVACNTATAIAINTLRKEYNIPFVGMEPAIKPAAELTKSNVVGILATYNTFQGDHYKQTSEKFAGHVEKVVQVGEGLVELVENNMAQSHEAFKLIEKYTAPMIAAGADHIVLGCTHYPFLIETIQKVAPKLTIVDPALPVAKRAKQVLQDKKIEGMNSDQMLEFFTTGELQPLDSFLKSFVHNQYIFNPIIL